MLKNQKNTGENHLGMKKTSNPREYRVVKNDLHVSAGVSKPSTPHTPGANQGFIEIDFLLKM